MMLPVGVIGGGISWVRLSLSGLKENNELGLKPNDRGSPKREQAMVSGGTVFIDEFHYCTSDVIWAG